MGLCAATDGLCLSSELFLSMAIVIIAARAAGLLFRYFKQPTVLGEIIAGILLGPSALGQIPGNIPLKLFPSEIRIFLNVCAQLGLIIFMFVVGLEVDVSGLTNSPISAFLIGGVSVILPFVVGTFALSPALYDKYQVTNCVPSTNQSAPGLICTPATSPIAFEMFIGVAMSVTAFPVLARIITDYKMIRLPVGSLVMACAALNDLVAWILLAICLAVKQASGGYEGVIKMIFASVGFFLALTYVLNPVLRFLVLRQYRQTGNVSAGTMAFVLINLLVCSWFLHYLGFHAMLGAFMFGLAFPRSEDSGMFHYLLEKLETVSVLLLLPCFFLVTGLSIDISKLGANGALDLLYVCIVAVFGKMLGAGLTALALRMGPRKSCTIAVLMNTRGLAEIVILNIGLQQGILNQDLFTIMVVMAVVTTVMAGPLLRIVYPPSIRERELLELDESLLKSGEAECGDMPVILAVIHDVSQAYRTICAGLDSLNPPDDKAKQLLAGKQQAERQGGLAGSGAGVQVVIVRFAERRGEMGTGLQETGAEVEERLALERCLTLLEDEAKVAPGGLVMLRLKDSDGGNVTTETQNIAQVLLPDRLVADWPADPSDQEVLKHTVLAAHCPVLLYTGQPSSALPGPDSTDLCRRSLSHCEAHHPQPSPTPPQEAARGGGWWAVTLEAIRDEFGGTSLACLLGLRAGGGGRHTPATSEGSGQEWIPLHSRDRLAHLRDNADTLLASPAAEPSAPLSNAAAPDTNKSTGPGSRVVLMIAGLGANATSVSMESGRSRAGGGGVQIDDVFRTLGIMHTTRPSSSSTFLRAAGIGGAVSRSRLTGSFEFSPSPPGGARGDYDGPSPLVTPDVSRNHTGGPDVV